jgi:hypothetical protein
MMHPRYRPEIARASVIRLRFPDRLVSCQSASAVFQTDHCAEARRFQSNVDAATILKPYCWSVAMNLRTLVTACALTVDPKIMHALIRHQSGGEPWAFSVSGHQPQVLRAQGTPSMQARHLAGRCRHTVGLAGLPGAPRNVTATMFAPCFNIASAVRQLAQLAERLQLALEGRSDPLRRCGLARLVATARQRLCGCGQGPRSMLRGLL